MSDQRDSANAMTATTPVVRRTVIHGPPPTALRKARMRMAGSVTSSRRGDTAAATRHAYQLNGLYTMLVQKRAGTLALLVGPDRNREIR